MLLGPVAKTRHLRIATLLDDGTALSFVDQRTFGGWMLTDLVTVDGTEVPAPVAHIARDPLDPGFDRDAVVKVLRRKHSEIKRQLLDQTVVSGIGNIYADEALWRAKVNGARIAETLTKPKLVDPRPRGRRDDRCPWSGRDVVRLALRQRQRRVGLLRPLARRLRPRGLPCNRCGAVMRRDKFMNRSSYYCPDVNRARGCGGSTASVCTRHAAKSWRFPHARVAVSVTRSSAP